MAESEVLTRRRTTIALIVILMAIGGFFGLRWYQRPKDIFDAAWKGDVESVQRFLDSGVSANVLNEVKDNPLHLAKTAAIAELLISHGSDIKHPNAFGGTPLHMAAVNGRPDVVRVLIKAGADVNAPDIMGATPLDHALVGRKKHAGDGEQDAVIAILQASGGEAQQNKALLK